MVSLPPQWRTALNISTVADLRDYVFSVHKGRAINGHCWVGRFIGELGDSHVGAHFMGIAFNLMHQVKDAYVFSVSQLFTAGGETLLMLSALSSNLLRV